jgi:hypothetical protein
VNVAGHEIILDTPPEKAADAVHALVDDPASQGGLLIEFRMMVTGDQQLPDRFQGQRLELLGRRAAVQVIQWAHRHLVLLDLGGRGPVQVSVVPLDPRPEHADQFGDRGIGSRRGRQGVAGCFPLRNLAGVLDATFLGAVLAQEDIAATSQAVGQRDDGLAGLLVPTVSRDVSGMTGRHAALPLCGRLPQV